MYLKVKNLPDAWFQAVYNLIDIDEEGRLKNGVLWKIDQGSYKGSYRLEYPFITIEIENPTFEPLLPEIPEGSGLPQIADMNYVNEYFINYFMGGELAINESYTYASRINEVLFYDSNETRYENDDDPTGIRQLDYLLDRLESHPNSNQLILQIAKPSDLILEDPPCFRSCQFKVIGNRLDFHISFRSNDLLNGFPINMAATAMFMDFVVACYPQFKKGKFIYFGSGLHIYDHAFEYAAARCYKPEFLEMIKKQMM